MMKLRAVWNSARRLYPALPEHPIAGVEFNPEEACKTIIKADELPGWWEKVRGIDNPIRRDLQITMLFTGLRATDASSIRWSEIDFKAKTIHRPSPKGGKRKSFTVPLCGYVVRVLARLRRHVLREFGPTCPWVFPTHNRDGKLTHTQEAKEARYEWEVGGKVTKMMYLPTPHTLRRTFRSVAHAAWTSTR